MSLRCFVDDMDFRQKDESFVVVVLDEEAKEEKT